MVCVSCGANLPSNPHFCPRCHAATSALGPHFVQVEKRLALLRHRYQSGQLDSAAFTQEVQKLIIRDEGGRLWWLGDQPGEWHWHDGQQWLRGQPQPRTQTAANTPVSPDLTPPVQRGGYKKWAIAGGLILILVAVALGAVWVLSNRTTGDQPFLAIAFSETSPQSLTVYIGEPDNHPFQLPTGDYYIEAVDGNGRVYDGWVEQITTLTDSGGMVEFDHLQTSNGREDEVKAGQLNTLANFLMSVKLAELSYLETFSDGFQTPLFTSESAGLQPFLTNLELLEGQETAVSPALTAFSARANASLTAQTNSTQSSNMASLNGRKKSPYLAALRPTLGVWDSLTNIFSQYRDGRDQTREDILDAFEIMTPKQRQEAFDWLPDKQKGGAQNYEEFLDNLSSGRLNGEIHLIHAQLLQSQKDYETAIKTLHPDSNRPGLEYYHEVGGQLVKLGAELEVEIIKTVLIQRFPDMAQGFDYADKTAAWAEFVKNSYETPLNALMELTGNALKDGIRDRIQQDIITTWPNIDEQVAEILADKMTNEVVDASADLATRIAQGLAANVPETGTDASWIDDFVQSATDQLLVEGEDPFAIAVQTEDLRDCLSVAAAEGLNKEEALVFCGVALDLLEDSTVTEEDISGQKPEPQPEPEPDPTPDLSWIDGYVQSIAGLLQEKGFEPDEIAAYIEKLRQCLTAAASTGLNQEEATAQCSAEMSWYSDGDWLVNQLQINEITSSCDGIYDGYFSDLNSDEWLETLAATGTFVMNFDGSGMAWNQTEQFDDFGDASLVQVAASVSIDETDFILDYMFVLDFHSDEGRYKTDWDIRYSGQYNFEKPPDTILSFQSEQNNPEIWATSGIGTITYQQEGGTLDKELGELRRLDCVTTAVVSGNGVLMQDGIITGYESPSGAE